MEKVYNVEECSWISAPVRILDCFKDVVENLPHELQQRKALSSDTRGAKAILPLMGLSWDFPHFRQVASYCGDEKLSVPGEPTPLNIHSLKRRQKLFDRNSIPSKRECGLATLESLRELNRNSERLQLKYYTTLWINNDTSSDKQNLLPNKDILVYVRVYASFKRPRVNSVFRGSPYSREFVVLGNQTLDVLRDKILCPSDMATEGEMSNKIGEIDITRAKDVFKSGFFFIENTFYNDLRDPNNCDYSESIEEWAKRKDIGPFKKKLMEDTKFEDLTVRFGYPYLYLHQGKCEHLIVFSDARLLHEKDNQNSKNYPFCATLGTKCARYCMICNNFIARWFTFDNDRVPVNPFFFCGSCFKSFNYIDGKKVGNFKAYELHHTSLLV